MHARAASGPVTSGAAHGMEVGARQAAIGGHAADGVARRHDARGAQLVDAVPEVKVLQRPIREVLALRDRLRRQVPLDQHARDTALAQLHRQRHAHRPAAHDRHLIAIKHRSPH